MALHDENQGRSPYRGRVIETFRPVKKLHEVNGLNALIGKEAPLDPSVITAEYFNAGLKYFKQSSDSFLRVLGLEAVNAVSAGKVRLHYAGSLEQSTIQSLNPKSKPLVFAASSAQGEYAPTQEAGLFVFPSLIADAQSSPASLLADLAGNLSLMRDYVNGKMYLDSAKRMAIKRAKAAEAHLLHNVLKEDPSLQGPILRDYGELLVRYPQGIKSLPGGEYRSIGRAPGNN